MLLLYQGKKLEGLTTLIATAGTFIGIFIYGKESENRNQKEKKEALKST